VGECKKLKLRHIFNDNFSGGSKLLLFFFNFTSFKKKYNIKTHFLKLTSTG
jgi:hypothetical protein